MDEPQNLSTVLPSTASTVSGPLHGVLVTSETPSAPLTPVTTGDAGPRPELEAPALAAAPVAPSPTPVFPAITRSTKYKRLGAARTCKFLGWLLGLLGSLMSGVFASQIAADLGGVKETWHNISYHFGGGVSIPHTDPYGPPAPDAPISPPAPASTVVSAPDTPAKPVPQRHILVARSKSNLSKGNDKAEPGVPELPVWTQNSMTYSQSTYNNLGSPDSSRGFISRVKSLFTRDDRPANFYYPDEDPLYYQHHFYAAHQHDNETTQLGRSSGN